MILLSALGAYWNEFVKKFLFKKESKQVYFSCLKFACKTVPKSRLLDPLYTSARHGDVRVTIASSVMLRGASTQMLRITQLSTPAM